MATHPPLPQTYILASAYISLSRCAAAYRRLLADLGCLAPSLEAAEVVVLHVNLGELAALLDGLPALRHKVVVGYLVWETDRLPPQLAPVLRRLDAIWTPSWYSARSLCAMHPRVFWLPHVVQPAPIVDAAVVADLKAQLRLDGTCTFLQVLASGGDPRKAGRETEAAMVQAARVRPGLRLITKQLPRQRHASGTAPSRVGRQGPIMSISAHFSPAQMAALNACCDYVVNGAHAEGWGLTLSDAMAAGVPTVTANYSGQKAFVHPCAGLLVPTQEAPVRPEHASANFEAPMRWGYMLPNQLAQAFVRAHDILGTPAYAAMCAAGPKLARAYDARHVRPLLRHLLRGVGERPRA